MSVFSGHRLATSVSALLLMSLVACARAPESPPTSAAAPSPTSGGLAAAAKPAPTTAPAAPTTAPTTAAAAAAPTSAPTAAAKPTTAAAAPNAGSEIVVG